MARTPCSLAYPMFSPTLSTISVEKVGEQRKYGVLVDFKPQTVRGEKLSHGQ